MLICIGHSDSLVFYPVFFFAIFANMICLHFTLSSDGVPIGVLFAVFGNIVCSQALYALFGW